MSTHVVYEPIFNVMETVSKTCSRRGVFLTIVLIHFVMCVHVVEIFYGWQRNKT